MVGNVWSVCEQPVEVMGLQLVKSAKLYFWWCYLVSLVDYDLSHIPTHAFAFMHMLQLVCRYLCNLFVNVYSLLMNMFMHEYIFYIH